MGRRLVALMGGALALGIAVASFRSDAAGEPPAGSGEPFAAVEEQEIRPAGELRVQGRRVHGSTFRTRRTVAEVIARERARWERASVDLVEQALPGGRLLSILDVPGGRHLVVAARAVADGTEVVRGSSPLGAEPEALRPSLLPAGWAVVGTVEDRLAGALVRTESALAPLPAAEAGAALRRTLAADGWLETGEAGAFERRGERLEVSVRGDARGALVQMITRGNEGSER